MKKMGKKDDEEGYPIMDNYKSLRTDLYFNVAFFTLGAIAVIGGIGYGLDLLFDTYPKLLIIGLFAGYPVTLMILRRRYKNYAQKKLKEEKNGRI